MSERRPIHVFELIVIAVALLATGGVGCTTTRLYDGPTRPREEIALIQTSSVNETRIRSIDGRKFSYLAVTLWPEPDQQMRIELLPGLHELVLYYEPHDTRSPPRADQTRRMKFQGGRVYQLMEQDVIESPADP